MDDDDKSYDITDDKSYDTIYSAVRDALAQQPKKDEKNQVTEALFILFVIWLVIAGLDYLSYARWINKLRYSAWYSVEPSQVQQSQDKPPSDCDFLKAPIGGKSCHYDKTVTYEHIITKRDINTNRPIVSYDEGKTWSWNDGDYPVSPSKTVYVSWQKIEE